VMVVGGFIFELWKSRAAKSVTPFGSETKRD